MHWRPSTGYCSPAAASIESVLLSNGLIPPEFKLLSVHRLGCQSRGLHASSRVEVQWVGLHERRLTTDLAKTRTVSRTPAARQTIPRQWPARARGNAYFAPQDLALPPRRSARASGTSGRLSHLPTFCQIGRAYITSGCASLGCPPSMGLVQAGSSGQIASAGCVRSISGLMATQGPLISLQPA